MRCSSPPLLAGSSGIPLSFPRPPPFLSDKLSLSFICVAYAIGNSKETPSVPELVLPGTYCTCPRAWRGWRQHSCAATSVHLGAKILRHFEELVPNQICRFGNRTTRPRGVISRALSPLPPMHRPTVSTTRTRVERRIILPRFDRKRCVSSQIIFACMHGKRGHDKLGLPFLDAARHACTIVQGICVLGPSMAPHSKHAPF
jgi:hypothetical protein